MTDDILGNALLTARVPRYTSYPPADRFWPDVGGAAKAAWLAALPPQGAVSLYVHVPFCRRLCWFCACRSQGTRTSEPLERFLQALAGELCLTLDAMPAGIEVATLHLGGGTPTILSPAQLDRLGFMLHEAFVFQPGAEVSVEIDPCEFDADRRDALLRMGLTRGSIGVQDFDPLVQEAIGRRQSAATTARAVDLLRAGGVGSVNFDLLYGLPHQTRARLARTLDQVLSLGPDRIALYGYAHVPWAAKRQKLINEAALPAAEARLELARDARATLIDAGYVPVGIDHFARPGDSMALAAQVGGLRRNFQGYTVDPDLPLVGLGPSAISQLPQGYVQNASSTAEWARMLDAGRLPGARGVELDRTMRAVGRVIGALMCDAQADIPVLAGDAAPFVIARAAQALSALPGAGVLRRGVLKLSDIRYARLIAHRIETGETPPVGRYSLAC